MARLPSIDWAQYDERGYRNHVLTTYHNASDGWYLEIPEGWRAVHLVQAAVPFAPVEEGGVNHIFVLPKCARYWSWRTRKIFAALWSST